MQPAMYSDTMPVIAQRSPGWRPIGSVYQALSHFPLDQNANVVAQGVPPASNFGSVVFPLDMWDPNRNYSMPLEMYRGSHNGSR